MIPKALSRRSPVRDLLRLMLVLAVATGALSCRGSSDDRKRKKGPATDPVTIVSTTLPGAVEGVPYSFSFAATGGEAPLSWTVSAGALPSSWGLNATTGVLSGTAGAPPAAGQFAFTVRVADAASPTGVDSRAFLLNVAPATFPSCPAGTPGTGFPPLDDPTPSLHLGQFETGLYEGSNARPDGHTQAAPPLEPLDTAGNPDAAGRYVLVSIGMSNTTQEFCGQGGQPPCDPWTFMGQAAADPAVNSAELAIVNGARGGQAASSWDSPTDPEYDRIRDGVLAPAGLTEAQVQAAWVKVANPGPGISLPDPAADAYTLVGQIGDIVRALRTRYPNLRQVFLTSRIYAGFATTALNPEPYAFESGLAVKWAIQAQIDQMAGGGVDARAGDLDPATVAAWLSWGPYVWADGHSPRASDGLYWTCDDLASDGTHPSTSGREKVGSALLHFFKTDEVAREWFLASP